MSEQPEPHDAPSSAEVTEFIEVTEFTEPVETVGTAATAPLVPAQDAGWAVPGAVPVQEPSPAYPPAYPSAAPAPVYGQPFQYQGYPGYGVPYQYPSAPDPAAEAAKKRKRKRILWISTASVAALALATVGVVALLPGRTGNSMVTAVKCRPSNLATCLIHAPAGAVQLGSQFKESDAWDQATAVSASLYSANITTDAAGVSTDTTNSLDDDGVLKVDHNDWNAVDGDNVDLVLLQFSSQKGAQAWNASRAAEIMAAYPGQAVAIPGDATGKAYAATKTDSQGNHDAAYSTVVGDLVLNVAYSSPNEFSAADLKTWAGTELASLRTAPAAAPDPADAPAGTQQVACGSGLGSCLAPMPSGSERWQSPNDKDWVSGSTLTQSQLIRLLWTSGDQATVTGDFNAGGVTGIAHTDWDTNNADDQADIYLVQTITQAGIGSMAGNFGEPSWDSGLSGISYTVPGESGTQAWYTNKTDSNGFIDLYFTATFGNVGIMGWLYFYSSLNRHTADEWIASEVNLVSRSVSSQPMGLFSLAAPTLPAPAQASCPASGDCLMPLPSGATDTTSASSYDVNKSVSSQVYAAQFEPPLGSDAATWLNADGFESGEHRSWTAAGGATVDEALLKYGKSAQAQAAVLLEYGENASADRVCTDAAVSDSRCLATPVGVQDNLQKETVWILAWKGDYEVSISVTTSDKADVAEAYTWAQQQLDLLPAN